MPKAFCGFETVRYNVLLNLWVLWEKKTSSVWEKDILRVRKKHPPCEKSFPTTFISRPVGVTSHITPLPAGEGKGEGPAPYGVKRDRFDRQSCASERHYLTKHSPLEIAEQSINPNPSVKLSFIVHPCKVQRKYVNLPTRITYYDKKYITHHKLEPATLGCYSLQARKKIKRYHH